MNHPSCQHQSRRSLLYHLLWLFGFLPLVYSVSPAQVPPSLPVENLALPQLSQPPRQAEFINDEAGVLTETEFTDLSRRLTQHNKRGPGRLLVCIIPRLPARQNSEQYATDWLAAVRERQTKGKWLDWPDRVLLLVVTEGRLIRIQASPAVWDLLTNDDRQRIIDHTIDPAITAGHFYQGIHAGVTEISQDLQTSPKPSVLAAILELASILLKYALFFLCCALLLIFLHEGSHALIGWLVGLRVCRIGLGYGRRLLTVKRGGLKVELNLIPLGGETLLAPRGSNGIRWRMWLAVAAGPGFHLVLAGLLYFLAHREPFQSLLFCACRPWLQFVLEELTVVNLIMLACNALPFRTSVATGPAASDGYQLLKLPFMKTAELDMFQAAEFMYRTEEHRQAGQPELAVALAETALQQYPENRALRLCLAHHRMGTGDYERARAEFTALLETCEAKTEAHRRIILLNNLAYNHALANRAEWLAEADLYSAEALRTSPAVTAFIGTRGAVLLRLGRVAEGLDLLKRSYRKTSDPMGRANEACWLAIGEALRGEIAAAQAWLQKARTGSPERSLLEQAEREVQTSQATVGQAETAQTTTPQKVEYTLTHADYFAFSAHKFRKSWLLRVGYWMLYLLGLGLLPVGLFRQFSAPGHDLHFLMFFLWLLAWGFVLRLAREVAIYWLVESKVRLMLRNAQRCNRLCPQSLTLNHDGLAHTKAGRETHFRWDQLKSLELGVEHCFFHFAGRGAYIVPTRAFDALNDASSFTQLAASGWQQAQPRKRTREILPVPRLTARVQHQPLTATSAFVVLALLLISFQRIPVPPVQAEARAEELRYDTHEGTTSLSALYQIAATQREEQNYASAEATFRLITQLEPLNAPGFVGLGAIHHLQERLYKAEQDYCHAHSLDQRSVSALIGLGSVLMDRQDYAHAEAIYRQALTLAPQSAEAHYCVARACRRQGKEAQAREHFRRVRELAPNSDYAKYAR